MHLNKILEIKDNLLSVLISLDLVGCISLLHLALNILMELLNLLDASTLAFRSIGHGVRSSGERGSTP